MKDNDKDVYIIFEINYVKMFPNMKEEEIFPFNWYGSHNYRLKAEILAEAIKKKVLIKDTDLYNNKFVRKF